MPASARIAGVNLPVNKHVWVALTALYGIGDVSARKICEVAGVNAAHPLKDLSEDEMDKIRNIIAADYVIEGDRRRTVSMHIKRKLDLGCYEGIRHRRGLPLRGQRTKTNARTRKGKRKGKSEK